MVRNVRKPIADFDTTLAVLLETNLQWIELVSLVAIPIGYHQSLNGQLARVLDRGKRGL